MGEERGSWGRACPQPLLWINSARVTDNLMGVRCAWLMTPWHVLAGVCWAAGALAQESLPVELDYHAPIECPDRAGFIAEVAERVPDVAWDPAPPLEPALRVHVEIFASGAGFEGRARLSRGGGWTDERKVKSHACTALVRALSLSTALGIDTVQRELAGDTPEPPKARLPPAASAAPSARVELPSANRFQLELFAALASPTGPALGGGGGALRIEFDRAYGVVSTQLGFLAATGSDARAEFTWRVALAELCPLGWVSPRQRAEICSLSHLGQIRGRGRGVATPVEVHLPWVDTGISIQWRMHLAGPWWTLAQGFGVAVLSQHSFVFANPHENVVPARAVQLGASLGLAATF